MMHKIKAKVNSMLAKIGILYVIGYIVTFLILFIPKDSKFDWKGKAIMASMLALLWPYFLILGIKNIYTKVKA